LFYGEKAGRAAVSIAVHDLSARFRLRAGGNEMPYRFFSATRTVLILIP
jgi:hypothetical protein